MAKKQTSIINSFGSKNDKESQIPPDPVQDRINILVEQIRYHRYLYYNKTPEISDAGYDKLEDELKQISPDHPVLQEIGQDSSELFTKKKHIIMMGSQDKVTSPEEFKKWARKMGFQKFIAQYKLDGISIELQYKSGIFQCAISRGDGIIGDDYTQNVMKMKGFVPILKDNFTGAVRGEILLLKDVFQAKYADKENCRNASSGLVRRKDGMGVEDLNLIYYDAVSTEEETDFHSEVQKLKWLKENGLEIVKTKIYTTAEEVISYRNEVMDTLRDTLNFDIDGLVIKGKDIDREDMKRPKPMKQIAFKFSAEEAETILLDVEWSESGHNYTPVAIVNPVRLMGTTVQRASLANPNLIADLGIKLGSTVIISKRGDIIPKIERVLHTPSEAIEISIPKICDTCNTPLINEGTRLYCNNDKCPKRAYHRLIKWLSILDVKNFSEKLMLRKLFESGKVRKIADLYALNASDLIKFEGVQEKSATKALTNLYTVSELPLEKFLAGFDIEDMGERLIKRVVDAGFDSLDKLYHSSVQELSHVEGFAEISAGTLLEGVRNLYPEMLQVLQTNKITIKGGERMSGKLKGMSFCFTGKLDTMKRAEAEQLVANHGGEAKNGVVKNLTYLVTNSTELTAKLKKAQEQGTKIISEQEFLDLINQ